MSEETTSVDVQNRNQQIKQHQQNKQHHKISAINSWVNKPFKNPKRKTIVRSIFENLSISYYSCQSYLILISIYFVGELAESLYYNNIKISHWLANILYLFSLFSLKKVILSKSALSFAISTFGIVSVFCGKILEYFTEQEDKRWVVCIIFLGGVYWQIKVLTKIALNWKIASQRKWKCKMEAILGLRDFRYERIRKSQSSAQA